MKRILKNIKTSFLGSIAGLSLIFDAIGTKDWAMAVSGVATMLLGLMAKDSDVQ
jgi:Fe2+ transport system protein B